MTEFKVEYRGYPVPDRYLSGNVLLGPTSLAAWKCGVDTVLDATPSDKSEYFASLNGGLHYAIRPSGRVEFCSASGTTIPATSTSASWLRARRTRVSRDSVPAAFRL